MASLPEQDPQEPGKLRTISREGKKGELLTLLQATRENYIFTTIIIISNIITNIVIIR